MLSRKTFEMTFASLVAPSGYCDKPRLNRAVKRLKSLGFKHEYGGDINSKYFYYAGDYKRRSQELNRAYGNKRSKIIFSIVGGMGAVHILPFLDYKNIRNSKKVFVGMSDITILLNGIYQRTGARCIHSFNIGKKGEIHKKTINSFFDALNKNDYSVNILNKDILKSGFADAKIIGGNISLLVRSLGTEYEVDTRDKILFLEEFDMKEWWVFDMLWQMKLAGKFKSVKGIILGDFIDCGENVNIYIKEFFKDFRCPVIMNQEIGHSEPNIAVPLGERCIIDTNKHHWSIVFSN